MTISENTNLKHSSPNSTANILSHCLKTCLDGRNDVTVAKSRDFVHVVSKEINVHWCILSHFLSSFGFVECIFLRSKNTGNLCFHGFCNMLISF